MVSDLNYFHKFLIFVEFLFQGLLLFGDQISPVKHLRLEKDLSRNEQKHLLQQIVEK